MQTRSKAKSNQRHVDSSSAKTPESRRKGRKQKSASLSEITKPDEKAAGSNNLKGKVMVNRAPVLTLWVAVVAEREGYKYEEGLSFGKWVAGILAHSKGRRLGLYEEPDIEKKEEKKRKRREEERFEVFGMKVVGRKTEEGLRLALQNGKVIQPSSVEPYCQKAFASNYERVKGAMQALAKAYSPKKIGKEAYSMYEKFRPTVPYGVRGWGAKGALDLGLLQDLTNQPSTRKD